MNTWRQSLALASASISDVLKKIDAGSLQISVIVDKNGRLLGTVTDGDVRRGILRGVALSDEVSRIMNREPVTATPDMGADQIRLLMEEKRIHQIPIVDKKNCVVDIKILDELMRRAKRENWVVLMAGGVGRRLRPLTNNLPKPLIQVGAKPLLETILENFIDCGFRNFFIAVNFRQEMIRKHFGNGSRWNVKIKYIKENKVLGTAGPLSLLPSKPKAPLIVMNGDLLTNIRFDQLLEFHSDNSSMATMAVREYDFQVPYGVVRTGEHQILQIDEKPVQRFLVNAGVYVLEPQALAYLPKNTFYDMPQLFDLLIKKKMPVTAFPIREYWLDIGHKDDLERANGDYFSIFGKS